MKRTVRLSTPAWLQSSSIETAKYQNKIFRNKKNHKSRAFFPPSLEWNLEIIQIVTQKNIIAFAPAKTLPSVVWRWGVNTCAHRAESKGSSQTEYETRWLSVCYRTSSSCSAQPTVTQSKLPGWRARVWFPRTVPMNHNIRHTTFGSAPKNCFRGKLFSFLRLSMYCADASI